MFHSNKGFLSGDVTHWFPIREDPPIKNESFKEYLKIKERALQERYNTMSYEDFIHYTNKFNPNDFTLVSSLSNALTKIHEVATRLLDQKELAYDHWINIKASIGSLLYK